MKKLAIIAILASAATMASANVEVELHGGRSFGPDQNYVGVSAGFRHYIYALTGGFDRNSDWKRYNVVLARDLGLVKNVTIAGKVGVAVIDPDIGSNGVAGTIGLGASYPLASHTSLVADVAYQRGQDKISDHNGVLLSAGLRYSF